MPARRLRDQQPVSALCAKLERDVDRALGVARRIRTGQIAVNGFGPGGAPFGGFKQSGFGRESGGMVGIRQYMEPKAMGLPA